MKQPGNQPITLPEQALMQQSIDALYAEIHQLRDTVQHQQAQLQSLAAEMLLRGLWKPIEQAYSLLGFHYDCCIVGSYDFVRKIPFGTDENAEIAELKHEIFQIFSNCFQSSFPCHCCEADIGLNTVLINVPDLAQPENLAEENLFLQCGETFLRCVEKELYVQLNLSFSFCCKDLKALPEALNEVRRIRQLQESFSNPSSVLYAGRLELEPQTAMPEPSELERQYMAALKLRNIPELHYQTQRLAVYELQQHHNMDMLQQNISRRLEKIQKQLGLGNRGLDILLEAQKRLPESHKMDELLLTLNQYFSRIEQLMDSIQAEEAHSHQQLSLAESVKLYLDQNYTDATLDLYKIAAKFGTKENKVSKVFKRKYGVGALSYIQKLRINKAMHLLTQNDLAISEIVSAAGFSNRRTFDRVFKQFTGITAAQYRQSILTASHSASWK